MNCLWQVNVSRVYRTFEIWPAVLRKLASPPQTRLHSSLRFLSSGLNRHARHETKTAQVPSNWSTTNKLTFSIWCYRHFSYQQSTFCLYCRFSVANVAKQDKKKRKLVFQKFLILSFTDSKFGKLAANFSTLRSWKIANLLHNWIVLFFWMHGCMYTSVIFLVD